MISARLTPFRKWMAAVLVSFLLVLSLVFPAFAYESFEDAKLGSSIFSIPNPLIWLENRYNVIANYPPYNVSSEAQALHSRLLVADMHCDPLLWGRDLTQKYSYGHSDLPRFREGNIGLVTFGVVTQKPEDDIGNMDSCFILAMLEKWPLPTYFSYRARALYQAAKFAELTMKPNAKLM
ncbi:MAG: hypothetical protein ACM3PE_05530, partial [Deltaproteobacteria bacterium]